MRSSLKNRIWKGGMVPAQVHKNMRVSEFEKEQKTNIGMSKCETKQGHLHGNPVLKNRIGEGCLVPVHLHKNWWVMLVYVPILRNTR